MSSHIRGISRRVLASDAASKMPAAACRTSSELWNRIEGEPLVWEARGNRQGLVQALRDIEPLCSSCPALLACGQWAQIELYSGFAAGQLYINGTPSPVPEFNSSRLERSA